VDRHYNREKLYKEVWAKPTTAVAAVYGVSDVAIKKACKKLNIPTPGRGYWQKVKVGAKIDRPPLPKNQGAPVARAGNSEDYDTHRELQRKVKEKIKSPKSEPVIKGSEQLRNPHPLVEQAHEIFKRVWAKSREKDPVLHLNEGILDIRVSKSSGPRALRIMDAVIKVLVAEGYSIGFEKDWKRTYVKIDGEEVYFRLHERMKQVPHVKTPEEIKDEKRGYHSYAPTYDHLPTGLLTLSIDYYDYLPRKNWSDTEKNRLEDCLNDFVAGLNQAAAQSKIRTEKRREGERLRLEAEERRRRQAELRTQETARFEELERQSKDWRRTQVIKEYIDAMEAALDASLPEDELARRREYIAWAREKAEWLDPLIGKEDPILGKRKPKD
jgi:hypothetical protein